MTEVAAQVQLPSFTKGPSFEPTRGPRAAAKPNPYAGIVAELAEELSPAGFSPTIVFEVESLDAAKAARKLFRQAGKAAGSHNTKVTFRKSEADGAAEGQLAVTAGIVPASKRGKHAESDAQTASADGVGVIAPAEGQSGDIDF